MKNIGTGALHALNIYITDQERSALEALAKEDARTLSSEVRALVKQAAKDRGVWAENDMKETIS